MLKDVDVLKTIQDKRDLIFTEAILIKTLKPSLNSQNEGADRILKYLRIKFPVCLPFFSNNILYVL
jgi:hypothetical protein